MCTHIGELSSGGGEEAGLVVSRNTSGHESEPIGKLNVKTLRATLKDPNASEGDRISAAKKLGFVLRMQQGHAIELACLKLKDVYVLHMPGELFVEHQLEAQKLRHDATVCMAAYGDYSPGYTGTKIAYSQGGYETQPSSSNVAPEVEDVLTKGIEPAVDRVMVSRVHFPINIR